MQVEHSDAYKLNLKSLSEGDHTFDYLIEQDFFDSLHSPLLLGGEVDVQVDLNKAGGTHTLVLNLEGVVDVPCDRCLEPVEVDLESEREIVVKFGAEYLDEGEDIVIVPEREGVIDLRQYIYEEIMLALPLQRLHAEEACDPEMLERFARLSVDELRVPEDQSDRDEEGIDHRWAALKKLRDQ